MRLFSKARCGGGGSAASVTRRRRVKSQEESEARMRSALAFADSVNYACAPRIIDVADWWRAPSPSLSVSLSLSLSLSLHLSVIRPLGSILFKLICFRCRFYILLSIARAIKKENKAPWPMGYCFHSSFNTSQRLNTLNKINLKYKTVLIQTTMSC